MNRIARYLVVVGALLAALAPTALARIQPQQPDSPDVDTAPTIVSYQGRVTVSGVPHEGTGYFKFALVNAAGNVSYWSNDNTSTTGNEPTNNVPLAVSAGLFNVLLGDTSLPGMPQALLAEAFSASDRYLRVWFATAAGGPYTQLAPDRRVGATPYALNAETLDGQDASAFAPAAHDHFGQTWTGAITTGLTLNNNGGGGLYVYGADYGVYGTSSITAVYGSARPGVLGQGYGVYGDSDGAGVYGTGYWGVYGASDYVGVYGENASTNGGTGVYGTGYDGVIGETSSTGGRGVTGISTAASGSSHGVYGQSDSTAGVGVVGSATATSGTTYGVYGESASTGGVGVYGHTSATSGVTYGVRGQSDALFGYGVYGTSSSASGGVGVYGTGFSGVRGVTNLPGGIGVWGSGYTYGVHGTSASTNGYGVWGQAYAGSGTTYGVYGQSDSAGGRGVYGYGVAYGVYGQSASTAGTGVFGWATATSGFPFGVRGDAASPSGIAVQGYATATSGVNFAVAGRTESTSGYGVYSVGNFAVVAGTKAAVVETEDYGWRHLYAVEAPGNWFEDFGQAQLVDGKATVAIEPVFAQTVNLDQSYMVFLTPLGDCAMYVAEQTPASFSVRAMGGQTCSVGFYYRIIAKRLGYEDLRLGPAQDPATMMPTAPPEEAPRDVRGR
jgi:hypothetical protein